MNKNSFVPLEKEIQKGGIQLLETYGILAYRRNVMAVKASYNGKSRLIQCGKPGMSDTWGILPDGRHIEVEFKRHGKRPTLEQVLWLRNCNFRCPAIWVDNLEDLKLTIEAILRGGEVVYSNGVREYGNVCGPSCDYIVRERI